MATEGVIRVDGWASHCRCGWRGPVRPKPLAAEKDGCAHVCDQAAQKERERVKEALEGLPVYIAPTLDLNTGQPTAFDALKKNDVLTTLDKETN